MNSTYEIVNLDTPICSKTLKNGVLGTAILIKLGFKSLRPLDAIIIEDEDGYIVPLREQAPWIRAYTNA